MAGRKRLRTCTSINKCNGALRNAISSAIRSPLFRRSPAAVWVTPSNTHLDAARSEPRAYLYYKNKNPFHSEQVKTAEIQDAIDRRAKDHCEGDHSNP